MTTAVLHIHLLLGLIVLGLLAAAKVRQFRAVAAGAAVLAALTGAFNFMTRMKDAPAGWHAFIGIKLLLALHVIAMVFLLARGADSPEKEARWRKGAIVSAVLVTLIGLYYSNFAR